MNVEAQPPEDLLRARRALEELPFYELVDDWKWYDAVKKWVLQCRLSVKEGPSIPAETNWFILADASYPWGEIELYPSKEGSLTSTFPHQSYNDEGDAKLPWREGRICAQTSLRYAGRRGYDIEPVSVDKRLAWQVNRAREWLEAAATGHVAEKGEPFELPDFPKKSIWELGFNEDEESFLSWQQQTETSGTATVVYPEHIKHWTTIASFSDDRERPVRTLEHGTLLSHGALDKASAMWIRLTGVPVLPPWQAPATFGELRTAMSKQGSDFDKPVFALAPRFRDGKRHFLLLGFPVPATVGGAAYRYHWQGLLMPALTTGLLRGYRSTELNFALNDSRTVLADGAAIDWVMSRNWAEEWIRTRGRASPQLTTAKVLLLGAGALGSSIAELLVREGCRHLLVVDGDILEIGNLCRHTLSLHDIQMLKADRLAVRLNSLSPHVAVNAITRRVQSCTEAEQRQMAECDVIIDCTGEDTVVHELSEFPWMDNKLFVSVSLGLNARRLFAFAAQGERFPHLLFTKALAPWLYKELEEHKGFKLPREGLGCWHPVFPARSDDVWLMSAVAVKCIDAWAGNPPSSACLHVYEQDQKDGLPAGVRSVAH